MWNFNGYGWIKEVESQSYLDEGYTHWVIERQSDGSFDTKATSLGSSVPALHVGQSDTLDEAKILVMTCEENKQPIFATVLIWLAVIAIVSVAVISIGLDDLPGKL